MAITGPIYWDGTNFPSQGGDPIAITELEFEDCCCPCVSCSGAQPDATVTVNVCVPPTGVTGGVYEFTSFTDAASCVWRWDGEFDLLFVRYTKATGIWTVELDVAYDLSGDDILSCVGGDITGTVQVTDGGICTADITFG